jgi:hypothetical protein
MRWIIAALLISITAAHAQTPMTGTTGAPTTGPSAGTVEQTAPTAGATAAKPHRSHRTLQERFDDANTTHDGHLTAEQARAKMPSVARDFAAIDTDHKGYVTIDQIKAHSKAVRAEKRAAKKAAKEQH